MIDSISKECWDTSVSQLNVHDILLVQLMQIRKTGIHYDGEKKQSISV